MTSLLRELNYCFHKSRDMTKHLRGHSPAKYIGQASGYLGRLVDKKLFKPLLKIRKLSQAEQDPNQKTSELPKELKAIEITKPPEKLKAIRQNNPKAKKPGQDSIAGLVKKLRWGQVPEYVTLQPLHQIPMPKRQFRSDIGFYFNEDEDEDEDGKPILMKPKDSWEIYPLYQKLP